MTEPFDAEQLNKSIQEVDDFFAWAKACTNDEAVAIAMKMARAYVFHVISAMAIHEAVHGLTTAMAEGDKERQRQLYDMMHAAAGNEMDIGIGMLDEIAANLKQDLPQFPMKAIARAAIEDYVKRKRADERIQGSIQELIDELQDRLGKG